MAEGASKFLFLLFLSLLTICSSGGLSALHPEFDSSEEFAKKAHKLTSFHVKTIKHDTINPPTTIFPINPTSGTPLLIPPGTSTPTIVTIPASNPITVTPSNPATTPSTVPSTTPITVPNTNPISAPVTVPGGQPITNPVTTYPSPSANVPITNPVAPPVTTTNAPAIPGQSWCVAKTGTLETTLQTALDYACGMGGADCSQIQQGGSCYSPNTLQNHASYAFNSYYQKNPVPTSCDFGGSAVVVSTNPSTGSCIYPLLSSSSSPQSSSSSPSVPTFTNPTPTPTTASIFPSPIMTTPPAGVDIPLSVTPPTVFNMSNPATGSGTPTDFGSEIPPTSTTSTNSSISASLRPLVGCIIVVISFVSREILVN